MKVQVLYIPCLSKLLFIFKLPDERERRGKDEVDIPLKDPSIFEKFLIFCSRTTDLTLVYL